MCLLLFDNVDLDLDWLHCIVKVLLVFCVIPDKSTMSMVGQNQASKFIFLFVCATLRICTLLSNL